MKILIGTAAAISIVLSVSLALANPAMLPKHPGYPGGNAVSPVTGQPLANDPGQTNAAGEKAILQGSSSEDTHSMQNLHDLNNLRLMESQGAGRLPKVQGPQIMIEPPVKEGTKIGGD